LRGLPFAAGKLLGICRWDPAAFKRLRKAPVMVYISGNSSIHLFFLQPSFLFSGCHGSLLQKLFCFFIFSLSHGISANCSSSYRIACFPYACGSFPYFRLACLPYACGSFPYCRLIYRSLLLQLRQ
jgi:hypothetical protein